MWWEASRVNCLAATSKLAMRQRKPNSLRQRGARRGSRFGGSQRQRSGQRSGEVRGRRGTFRGRRRACGCSAAMGRDAVGENSRGEQSGRTVGENKSGSTQQTLAYLYGEKREGRAGGEERRRIFEDSPKPVMADPRRHSLRCRRCEGDGGCVCFVSRRRLHCVPWQFRFDAHVSRGKDFRQFP